MNNVLLIGTIPPPIGGISVHLDRFLYLYDGGHFKLSLLDMKKRKLFSNMKSTKSIIYILKIFLAAKIIHIHVSNNYIKTVVALLSKLFLKKVIYTHHNSIVNNRGIFRLMYRVCDQIILVNDKEIDNKLVINSKTEVIPAFLPPYNLERLPSELEQNINSYSRVISTNCYLYNLYKGKHVYGFDVIVNAFYNLSKLKKVENTLLVLVDPSGTTEVFVNDLLEGLNFGTNKVLYIPKRVDFVSLVKKSSLTIRATRTDGDSISVRESLYFGVPIIASDVTERPEGTITFKNEDVEDLSKTIVSTLSMKEKVNYRNLDYGEMVIKSYDNVLGTS